MPRQTEPDPIVNRRRPSVPRGLRPSDMPDDFGLDDPDHGYTISLIALGFAAALIMATAAVLWVVLA